jgi:hypothetical protein
MTSGKKDDEMKVVNGGALQRDLKRTWLLFFALVVSLNLIALYLWLIFLD